MKREYEGAGANASAHAMLGSHTHTWATPPELFAALDAEFGFTLDPCCLPDTAKCAKFYTPAEDGLAQDWSGERVFMNPPYGRALRDWMRKARDEAKRGALVVCLVPSRTGTGWWHDYVIGQAEVRFLRGRVPFLLNGKRGAPAFDSAIIIYRPPMTCGATPDWDGERHRRCIKAPEHTDACGDGAIEWWNGDDAEARDALRRAKAHRAWQHLRSTTLQHGMKHGG